MRDIKTYITEGFFDNIAPDNKLHERLDLLIPAIKKILVKYRNHGVEGGDYSRDDLERIERIINKDIQTDIQPLLSKIYNSNSHINISFTERDYKGEEQLVIISNINPKTKRKGWVEIKYDIDIISKSKLHYIGVYDPTTGFYPRPGNDDFLSSLISKHIGHEILSKTDTMYNTLKYKILKRD